MINTLTPYCDGFHDNRNGKTYHLASFAEIQGIFQKTNAGLGYIDPWAGWASIGTIYSGPQRTCTATSGLPDATLGATTKCVHNGGVEDIWNSLLVQKATSGFGQDVYFVCVAA